MQNIVNCGKYSHVKFVNFVCFCITCGKALPLFEMWYFVPTLYPLRTGVLKVGYLIGFRPRCEVIRNPVSEIRNPGSEIRNPSSESDIQGVKSRIQDVGSRIQGVESGNQEVESGIQEVESGI